MDGLSPYVSLRSTKETSPMLSTGAKIMQLNEKLTSLSSTMETPQPSRNHEYRLKQLEESTDKHVIQEEACFAELRDDLLKIGSQIAQEKAVVEEIQITSLRQIKQLQSDVVKEQISFRSECKQQDLRVLQAFEDSSSNLKLQWKKQIKLKDQLEAQCKRDVESQVATLEDALTFQIKLREQKNDSLISSLSSALNTLTNSVNQERKKREQNHLQMLRHLQELNSSMQAQLKHEQNVRDKADQLLYKLLEETCTKVEGCILKRKIF